MANKPKTIAQPPQNTYEPALLAQAGEAAQDLQVLTTAFSDAQYETTFLIGQRIGRKSILESLTKLHTVTGILDLKKIKETKQYKGLRIFVDEKPVNITTWEAYCLQVEGRSVESIDLDLKNFETLGEDFFNATRQLGIGPATMRSLRRLPDDQKDALLEIANTGDKDIFLQTIDDLSAKHAKEKEAHAGQLAKAQADLVAKERALTETSKTIQTLHAQLGESFEPRPDSVAKTQAEEALLEEIGDATLQSQFAIRRVFLMADKAFESPASDAVKAVARQGVEYLCQELAAIAREFNVTVDFEKTVNPPWLTAALASQLDQHIAQDKAQAKAASKASGKPQLASVKTD